MKRALLVAAVLMALGASGAKGASRVISPPPCSWERCIVRLKATTRVKHWRSSEQFAIRDTVQVIPYIGDLELEEEIANRCAINWYGLGVSLRTSLCGAGKVHLRVSYVSLAGVVPIKVTYRVVGQ